jgi:hypothetical protein
VVDALLTVQAGDVPLSTEITEPTVPKVPPATFQVTTFVPAGIAVAVEGVNFKTDVAARGAFFSVAIDKASSAVAEVVPVKVVLVSGMFATVEDGDRIAAEAAPADRAETATAVIKIFFIDILVIPLEVL